MQVWLSSLAYLVVIHTQLIPIDINLERTLLSSVRNMRPDQAAVIREKEGFRQALIEKCSLCCKAKMKTKGHVNRQLPR